MLRDTSRRVPFNVPIESVIIHIGFYPYDNNVLLRIVLIVLSPVFCSPQVPVADLTCLSLGTSTTYMHTGTAFRFLGSHRTHYCRR